MERNKALSHARNPGLSKYGQCLVRVNTRLNNQLKTNLAKINADFKRMDMQTKRKKNFFIKTSGLLNHEPILLVQRPKSEPIADTTPTKIGNRELGFMKPRSSNIVRPSSHKTIDIYTVQPTKKKNLWENLSEDKAVKFTSLVRPCAKLSQTEIENLRDEYSATKPALCFDKTSKTYVLSRSDLAPSSAKRKRLSGLQSPESEHEGSLNDQKNIEDDNDDNDDYDLLNEVIYSETDTRQGDDTAVLKIDNLPRSSSFITDIETFDQIANETLQQNAQNYEKHESEKNEDSSLNISKNGQSLESTIIKDTHKTDTISIPNTLQNDIKPTHSAKRLDIKYDIIVDISNINENDKQHSKVSEHERVEQTVTLPTKGNLSNFNVAKAGILGKVLKAQSTKKPTKKHTIKSTTSAGIHNIRKDGSIRKFSAKSVKFSAL